MRTDPHEHKHSPGMTPRSHRHALTEVDAALEALAARVVSLEEAMANVVLTISQLPGPVTPPVDPIVPVTPPVDPPVVPVVISGAAWYISPTGNDTTGNGTQTYPWKTLARFLAKPPLPGDTLFVRGGTLAGTGNRSLYLRTAWSGTPGHPVTIRNYPGETAVFDGQSAGGWIIGSRSDDLQGASWWVIDGLHFQNYGLGASLIHIGNWDDDNTDEVGNWAIRNCRVLNFKNGVGSFDHCIYMSVNAKNVTIEDNRFKGPYPVPGVGTGETGACLHFHHPPQNTGHVIQRNIIESWEEGIQLWNTAGTHQIGASILHNSFLDCGTNIDARYHGNITIRDNAGESGRSHDVYDPYDSAYTTADHNYWGQEFDSSYFLLPGETGIDAASDGTDAGALDT